MTRLQLRELAVDAGSGIGCSFDAYGSNRTLPRAMTAFAAIAWYNAAEILVLSLFFFKRYSGLYFWSVIVCAISIAVYATGAWTYENVNSVPTPAADALLTAGWVVMIPSQSLVLWSRLHLITQNRRLLRFLLWLIIIDSLGCISVSVVFNWGALMADTRPFLRGYSIMEKIQMCVFTAQEVSISTVYLYEVRGLFRIICEKRAKGMLLQLVAMNVLVIALDLAMLVMLFCDLLTIQITLKSLVYSVKLKMEFAVLSKIISVVKERSNANTPASHHHPWNSFVKRLNTEKGMLPTIRASIRSRTTSSAPLDVPQFQDQQGRSFDSSAMHSLSYPEAAFRDDEDRYVRSLQQNIPANWRLSIGHEALTGPNLLEIRQQSQTTDVEDAAASMRAMYPGKLE